MYILALALPVLLHHQYFGPFNVCVSPLMRPIGPPARTSKQKIREQVSQFYLRNFEAMWLPIWPRSSPYFEVFDFSDLHFCFDNSKGSGIAKQNTDDERHVE